MGIALSIVAMLGFASNILFTRYALARMPLDAGFFIVLAVNIVFPAALFGLDLGIREAPWVWSWKGGGAFALSGVVGTFVGRRMLFDAVRLLGPARASVFHSTAPIFALVGAWLLADERLGIYELVVMTIVMVGLLFTQPRATYTSSHPDASALRGGMLAGLVAVAGFGLSNVIRGTGVRAWNEPVLGAVISAAVALLLQIAATRNWKAIAAQFRAADRKAYWLYAGCGVATSVGAIFLASAMRHMEIALAVLVVHSTPLVIFPVSVFILRNREGLNARTLLGAVLVLGGIVLLSIR